MENIGDNAALGRRLDGKDSTSNISEREPVGEKSSKEFIKDLYKKMTLPNLKATVVAKVLCSDPSKMKKNEILKLLEEE